MTCDPGVDDAIALAVAAGRGHGDVRAVVAGAGNVDAPTAWRNATGLAALFGLDVPVGIGSDVAVGGARVRRHGGGGSHGSDGLAGLSALLPPPADSPTAGASLVGGDVVAIGPLTDVALALRAGQPIDRLVWMGGASVASSGTTPVVRAEFNATADPEAVNVVLGSRTALAVVPLHVTRQVSLTRRDLDLWAAGSAAARLCAALASARHGPAGAVLHDPVALMATLEPGLFAWRPCRLRCALGDGHPRGALLTDPHAGGDAQVAVAVEVPAVRRRIVEAVLALPA